MNSTEHNLLVDAPNLAIRPTPTETMVSRAPKLGALASLRVHWPEYLMEASLLGAFRASYHGNRAPLSIGFHFETWDSWAYDHALTRFLVRVCRVRDVRCASIRELVDWLDGRPQKQH